jgi:hypothetical protein
MLQFPQLRAELAAHIELTMKRGPAGVRGRLALVGTVLHDGAYRLRLVTRPGHCLPAAFDV